MVRVLFAIPLLVLDDDLLEMAALETVALETTALEIELELRAMLDELLITEELLTTEELAAIDDLLELEIIALDDDLEEDTTVLDATDDVAVPHKLPFTLGALAVPLA